MHGDGDFLKMIEPEPVFCNWAGLLTCSPGVLLENGWCSGMSQYKKNTPVVSQGKRKKDKTLNIEIKTKITSDPIRHDNTHPSYKLLSTPVNPI